MKKLLLLLHICLLFFACSLTVFSQTLTVREIMREPSLAGMRPDSEKLSPDGKLVAFSWNSEGKEPRHLYLVSTGGGQPQIIVDAEKNYEMRTPAPESKLNYGLIVRDDFARAREKNLGGAEFSPDSKRLLFTQNSDIYVLEIDAGKSPFAASTPRRITRTQGAEFAARWLDDATILYQSGGNFFALNIEKTYLVQLTREANPAAFVAVSFAAPTEDAKMLAYAVSDGSKQRALFVPNYLDEYVQSPTFRRGFSEQKIFVTNTDGSLERPFEIKIPKADGAGYLRGVKWAADNRSLIVDRVDKDLKRRQLFYIYNAGSKDEQMILVTEETDEKWIAPLSSIVEPNPQNAAQLFFCSEMSGYNHLYLATLERNKPQQNQTSKPRGESFSNADFTGKVEIKPMTLTTTNIPVEWAKWSSKNRILFSQMSYPSAGRRFHYLDVESGNIYEWGSTQWGFKTNAQMADAVGATTKFIYQYSEWNKPTEIYAADSCNTKCEQSPPVKLTSTTPPEFLSRKWNEPKIFNIPSRDNKNISSKIYLPDDFDKTKKYPMVIFVHGAGYLQNVINGWNNYYREFMFNEMLTQKGYVVLDIDYRGSAGYGRGWRTDVYDFLGGKDYEDHLDAIDFAVKNYAVDEKRVGVYGGSYGGFMAGMLVMRAPDKIAAAAALRPVFDWKNYFASSPVYTAERLGFPDKNAEGYKRSSPISYADQLRKPLLILHGVIDDNVPAQDSMQLIEKLIRLEKTQYFEAMLYPSENHAFQRPTSWTDEYERILTFFEKHLK